MSSTDENKAYILNEFLLNIWGISDKQYQKRVWIQAEGPECDDYDETCCQFFDTTDFILERFKEYGLTVKQFHILKKFRDEFGAFSDDNFWPPFFIDSPEWSHIMERAKEVLKAFNYKI